MKLHYKTDQDQLKPLESFSWVAISSSITSFFVQPIQLERMTPEGLHIQLTNDHARSYFKNKDQMG